VTGRSRRPIPKGAISAALGFVPVPGLEDAFGFASKMLFKGWEVVGFQGRRLR
jgi:hypothetical protein